MPQVSQNLIKHFLQGKIKEFFKENIKVLDCTFDIKQDLKKRLDELCMESELAVREGVKHLILTDKKINEQKAQIPMVLAVGAVNSKLINQGIRGFVSINLETKMKDICLIKLVHINM